MLYVLPAFLSPDECDEIVACFPSTGIGLVNDAEARASLRRSRVSFLPKGAGSDIAARLGRVAEAVNTRHYRFEITGQESLQLAEYGVGDEYGQHLDIGVGSAALRKLSASVQLSCAGDYDGGDLEIFGSPPVDRDRGALILFPSYLAHRVSPVTRGLRRSLVAWFVGTHPFR